MRIEIDIPKEFEEHFKQDKFKDSLERIMADIWHSLENGDCLCAGRYEYETIKMLEEALENSKSAYDIDKVVEEIKTLKEEALGEYNMGEYNLDNNIGNSISENYRKDMNEGKCFAYDEAIEIVKQGGISDASDNVCEWKSTQINNEWNPSCEPNSTYNVFGIAWFKRCPYCGKNIKVVK